MIDFSVFYMKGSGALIRGCDVALLSAPSDKDIGGKRRRSEGIIYPAIRFDSEAAFKAQCGHLGSIFAAKGVAILCEIDE